MTNVTSLILENIKWHNYRAAEMTNAMGPVAQSTCKSSYFCLSVQSRTGQGDQKSVLPLAPISKVVPLKITNYSEEIIHNILRIKKKQFCATQVSCILLLLYISLK